MEAIGVLVLIGVALGVALVRAASSARADPLEWHAIARACGLSDLTLSGHRSEPRVTGRLGDLHIRFTSAREGGKGTVVSIHGLAKHVVVKRENLGTRLDKALSGGELQIGDRAFDEAVYIRGDKIILLALLDTATRESLLSAFSMLERGGAPTWLELERGELRVRFAAGTEGPEAVRTVLRLAHRLRQPPDPVTCLVQNLGRERLPEVRRAILDALDGLAPSRAETRSAIERAAREDEDPGVRLRAALWLGLDGWPTLHALAEDGSVPDDVSARAIEELGERVALDVARRIAERSLASGRIHTARAAVSLLGPGGESAVGPLAAVLERAVVLAARETMIAAAWYELAVAATRALGRTGSASAEPVLVRTLAREPEELQLAAAQALGPVGSAASVTPLKELAEGSQGRVRSAALEATARIRRRLTGVDPGRLALIETADGQLTLADDEHGRVSLPETKDAT